MLDSNVKTIADRYINKKINRRKFLMTVGVFTGSVTLGSLLKYFYDSSKFSRPFTKTQNQVILNVQEHLFPKSADGPGASDMNALHYLHFVLTDPEIDEDNKNLLINGVKWLEEECYSEFNKSFVDLTTKEKETILRTIEETNWGSRWLSLLLLNLFEAVLSDPIYGGNPDEIGWKWLNHGPGLPRPNTENMYGKL